MRMVLATRNQHKLREFRELLAPHELIALPKEVELPPETAETFTANAEAKAAAAHAATGEIAIADDSGIEATALEGAPGVRSARFAGEGASDEDNLAKLLEELDGADDRRAAYVCALAYEGPGGRRRVFAERCDGTLISSRRGDGGFGYDPAFVPDDRDDGRTMAELSPAEKDAISHRGRAARALLAWLGESGR